MKRLIAAFIGVLMMASMAVAQDTFKEITGDKAFLDGNGYIQVIGMSEAGQSRFRAITAARVVAQQRMLQVIKGVKLIGQTTVQDGILASQTIRTNVQGFLQGAEVVQEQYDMTEKYAQVVLRLPLRGHNSLYSNVAPTLRQLPAALKIAPMPQFKPQAAAPAPAPAKPVAYDGLIIIVEGMGFKPALANRILTEKHDILFEPSKVSPQMLIERGCGGYTTTEDKAKALLSTWGSKSPLVVKCTQVVKGTEAVVSVKDATVIFEQNQKSNMLPQAKVVFVL